MKEVKIISDGSMVNTQILYGDEKLRLVQRVEVEIDASDAIVRANLYFAKGHLELSAKDKEQIKLMVADGYEITELSDLVKENKVLEKQVIVMKQKIKELKDSLASLEIKNEG